MEIRNLVGPVWLNSVDVCADLFQMFAKFANVCKRLVRTSLSAMQNELFFFRTPVNCTLSFQYLE